MHTVDCPLLAEASFDPMKELHPGRESRGRATTLLVNAEPPIPTPGGLHCRRQAAPAHQLRFRWPQVHVREVGKLLEQEDCRTTVIGVRAPHE